jgi:hypothetical protein
MANFFDQFDSSGGEAKADSPYAGAISAVESGGNYHAVGPNTGSMGRALGKYQVMSENVAPWSKEVLGREVSPSEFLGNPKIQDAIFNGKFGQYVDKYGPDGAARAWFAGEKGMHNPNAKDAFGTTVSEYSRRFNKALGPQDARAAVEQFGQGEPNAMAFAPKENASPINPAAKNFFDQFDEAPAAAPAEQPAQPSNGRLYIGARDAQAKGNPAQAVPDRGVIDATARGAAQGLSANFSDEIRGLVEASGANPNDPASLSALISGALKYWSGDKDAKKKYDEAVQRERAANKTAEEQHPIASTVGQIGGAVVLPVGVGAQAATLPGRIAAGAATGGVLGGVAGAGEGEGGIDSLVKAGTGAMTGAALGGAAPAAIEGVIRGARAVAQPVANTLRGVRSVDDEAARRIALAAERDMQIDPQGARRLSAQEFVQNSQNGGPAALIDVGGETTKALARSAANTSPEGRAALNAVIDPRYEGQSVRVNDWLRKTFNYPDAEAQQAAIEQASRNVNRPAYQKAYQEGSHGIWDDGLEQISQAPVVQDAIRKATITGANDAAKAGFTPVRNPFQMSRETGRMELRTDQNGTTALPNLQFWDTVKKNLDKVGTRDAQDFSRVLREHLDAQVPSYQQARAGAAHYFGASNALEAGQNFITSKMDNAAARQALAKMTPNERQLFQDGFVSQYQKMLNEVGDRRNILNKIAESPAARERLEIAMGKQKAAEFEAIQRVEGVMDLARTAIQGNSTTARQLAELGLAGGAYGFSGGATNPLDPGAMMNAALVYGAARGRNKINERLSRRVAEMLASSDPQTLLRGIQVVARNRELFNALRGADRGLARISAGQAPTMPAIASIGVGRASDQPDAQRPAGQ